MERRFQYYVPFTNHTQYRARARAREHNNTMENFILNFTHLFHVHEHWLRTVCGKKPFPFNETERNGTGRLMKRNGPFTIRSSSVQGPCVFAVRFESVLIKYYYIRTALSALAHGSL